MLDLQKALDEIEKSFDNMSQEDFVKDVLHLNGVMTIKLFDKVMKELSEKLHLNDETISYHKEKYNITIEEYMDVFHYLETISKDEKFLSDESFPQSYAFFTYKGKKFIWDLLVGQGSSCSLYVYGYNNTQWVDDLNITIKGIDPNIRFYKRLDKDKV
jgi:hypothetical protein